MNNKHAASKTRLGRERRVGSKRALAAAAVLIALPVLLLSACTTYHPIGQGAKVPWSTAFAVKKGGPIEGDRYRVSLGDSLSSIAQRYGVRVSTLAAVNNIEPPFALYPGEVLRIPPAGALPAARPAKTSGPTIQQTELPPEPAREPRPTTQTARAEPSESQPIEPQQIEPQRVEPGAVEPGAAESKKTEPKKTEPKKTEPKKTEPKVTNDLNKRHLVAPGESLSVIAHKYNLRLSELVATNKIEPPYRVTPGQVLLIPSTETERRRQVAAHQSPTTEEQALLAPPPLSREGFLWPVDGRLISTFEDNAKKGRSGGVSIAARKGTPVRAADNGIVAYAGEALSGYGQMLMLRHADGYLTLYAHNDTLLVKEGDVVRRGQTIAEVGSSGDVIESQLHFELRKGTEPIDPAKVLAGLPGRRLTRR